MTKNNDKARTSDDTKPGKGDARQPAAKPDRSRSQNDRDTLSKRLDEGLEETFPSSDPVSVTITK